MTTSHSIVRDGVRLAYVRRGEGPLVVLVHGLGLSGDAWGVLPDALGQRGFTVVTPDNRGMGASDVPPPPYRMATLADDTAAVIADAGAGPALVVGISLGGMIAQELAIRHPARVAGLVLAATSCGLPFGRLPSPLALASLVASLFVSAERARIGEFLAHPDSLARDPGLLLPLFEGNADQPAARWRRGALGQLAAAIAHGTGFALPRIACPTEIITGDSDRIMPPANAPLLARRIPGARVTIVPRAGHVFPLEAPDALPRVIVRLAEQVFGGAR